MTSPSRISPLTRLRKRLSGDSPDDTISVNDKNVEEQLAQLGRRKKGPEPKAERGNYGLYRPVAHWTDEPEL
jgi:hypothetical protein